MDARLYISNKRFLSWLDHDGGRVLSRNLERRLTQKFLLDKAKTNNSLFVTLTFDRSKYGDPLDPTLPEKLWDEACEKDGHIKLFIRRLSRLTGEKYTGKWLCKREFQEGGFLHYHLIFYDTGRIEHADMLAAWGLGHVWIDRINRRTAGYVAKYQGKAEGLPGWLYDKTGRTVKLVSCSPGFWRDVHEANTKDRGDAEPRKRLNLGVKRKRFDPSGIPHWLLVERARRLVVVRDGRGNTYKFTGDATRLAVALRELNCEYIGQEYGGYVFEGNMQDARYALHQSNLTNSYPDLPGLEYIGAYSSQNDQDNHQKNYTAGGGSAAARLLDTTHKNGDTPTQPNPNDDDRLDPWSGATRWASQVEAFGADVMASIDPGYMESGVEFEPEEGGLVAC